MVSSVAHGDDDPGRHISSLDGMPSMGLGVPRKPDDQVRFPGDVVPSLPNLVFYFYGVCVAVLVLVLNLNVVTHFRQSVFEERVFTHVENHIEYRQ